MSVKWRIGVPIFHLPTECVLLHNLSLDTGTSAVMLAQWVLVYTESDRGPYNTHLRDPILTSVSIIASDFVCSGTKHLPIWLEFEHICLALPQVV